MITENNVIESIKDSVNLADVSPENFESTVEFIHRQYEIVLKAKDKEIEEYRQEISHLRKMVESLAKEPIIINLENKKNAEDIQEIANFSTTDTSVIQDKIQEDEIFNDLLYEKLVNFISEVKTLSFAEKEGLRNVLTTLSQPERNDLLCVMLEFDEEIGHIFGESKERQMQRKIIEIHQRIRCILLQSLSELRDSDRNSVLKEYILQNI
jgi:uncharacterized protein YjgD (DUF1641 family)